jgi:hypothetical protein
MSAFLNRWDPNQLIKYKPFITAACGFRRSGKSFLQAHILNKLCHEFQLVCSFTGSLNCSPEMQKIFEHKLDPRFQFQKLNIRFLKTLMIQQETLARNGTKRSVLLLFDDVFCTRTEQDYLAFFATRARHFDCSLMFSAVSYTSLGKNYRRSLDFLFLFGQPLYTDKKYLLVEFSKNPSLTELCLTELEEYQCLVLQNTRKSKMYVYKVTGDNPQNSNVVCLDQNETLGNLFGDKDEPDHVDGVSENNDPMTSTDPVY